MTHISEVIPPALGFWFLSLLTQFIIIWLLFSASKAAKEKESKEKLLAFRSRGYPHPILSIKHLKKFYDEKTKQSKAKQNQNHVVQYTVT